MTLMKDFPFALDREAPTALVDQITGGISGAIRSGYYEPGERLPCIGDMADGLQVAQQTVRGAVRRLVDRGELVARRGAGIHVVENVSWRFRAHVLEISSDGRGYYFATRSESMATTLMRGRVRPSQISFSGASADDCLRNLRILADTNPLDLVIFSGHMPASVLNLCHDRGIRYISAGSQSKTPGHSALTLPRDAAGALSELTAQVVAAGHRSAAVLWHGSAHPTDRSDSALAAAGLHVTPLIVPTQSDGVDLSRFEMAGYEIMARYLRETAEGERADFVFITDDYLGRGALMAIAHAGVDVPGDMAVALRANAGHWPAWPRRLSGIQYDPREHGRLLAEVCLSLIDGNRAPMHLTALPGTFIPGETLKP